MATTTAPVNYAWTGTGKVRPRCEFCGRDGQALTPHDPTDPRPRMWQLLGTGWSCAPLPADVANPDGSYGTTYTCPACLARLDAGEALRPRGEPLTS